MDSAHRDSPGTLATIAYTKLRQDLIHGAFDLGSKLRIQALCERYGIGLNPIREALNRLSSEGFVVQTDQRGFQVAELSIGDLEELTKARCWLDGLALRESIQHGNQEWEEGVVLAYHRLSRLPRYLDSQPAVRNPDWSKAHKAFHVSLLSACGTKWIEDFCDQMFDAAERYRNTARNDGPTSRSDLDEHRAIMEATIARKADLAVELLTQHFQLTSQLVRNVLENK